MKSEYVFPKLKPVWCSKHATNFQFLSYLFLLIYCSYFFSIYFLFLIISLVSTHIFSDIIEESESR
jgi:hypothetical protein